MNIDGSCFSITYHNKIIENTNKLPKSKIQMLNDQTNWSQQQIYGVINNSIKNSVQQQPILTNNGMQRHTTK